MVCGFERCAVKQKYELKSEGIWDNDRNCWFIWIGIDQKLHGDFDFFNEFLRLASERIGYCSNENHD